MKTLYKNSRLIAAAIVGTMVFSAGTAVALTKETSIKSKQVQTLQGPQDLGRFVITPTRATYLRPAEELGRFVVSQNGTTFVPVA